MNSLIWLIVRFVLFLVNNLFETSDKILISKHNDACASWPTRQQNWQQKTGHVLINMCNISKSLGSFKQNLKSYYISNSFCFRPAKVKKKTNKAGVCLNKQRQRIIKNQSNSKIIGRILRGESEKVISEY